MTKLTAYFDESGTDGRSPIVAVGGYVSTDDRWDDFQREWEQFRDDEGFNVFHTTDLLSLRGAFAKEKGWDKIRADNVMRRADSIIEKYVLFGVVCYTHITNCEEIIPVRDKNSNRKLRKKFEAEYLFSGVQVVIGVSRWARENGYTEPIKYVFEDGANGKGYLMQATECAKRDVISKEKFLIGSIAFEDKDVVPQLQPADKLIHQSCNALINHVRNKRIEEDTIEKLIRAKLKKVYVYDEENLPQLLAVSKAINSSCGES